MWLNRHARSSPPTSCVQWAKILNIISLHLYGTMQFFIDNWRQKRLLFWLFGEWRTIEKALGAELIISCLLFARFYERCLIPLLSVVKRAPARCRADPGKDRNRVIRLSVERGGKRWGQTRSRQSGLTHSLPGWSLECSLTHSTPVCPHSSQCERAKDGWHHSRAACERCISRHH